MIVYLVPHIDDEPVSLEKYPLLENMTESEPENDNEETQTTEEGEQ